MLSLEAPGARPGHPLWIRPANTLNYKWVSRPGKTPGVPVVPSVHSILLYAPPSLKTLKTDN